jgi:hypothetical protein
LLKRLHLEPWTASASQLKQTEVEKALKASSMINLRADLDRVRILSEQVQKRERQKLERIRKQKAYLEMILYPAEIIIRPVLECLIDLDKKKLFRYPVTLELAPDYLDVIKQPMSFADIIEKLANHRYDNLDEFESDLALIWKNSMTYNKAETGYYKLAQRLEKAMTELMADAREAHKDFPLKNNGLLDVDINPEIFAYLEEQPPNPPQPVDPTINSSNKRRLDDAPNTTSKKRRLSPGTTKKKSSSARVTRSTVEKNKRALRSRSAATPESTLEKRPEPLKKPRQTRKPVLTSKDKEKEKEKQQEQEEEETGLFGQSLKLVDNEIVWARVRTYPPHPAKIFDPKVSKKGIPKNVLSLKPKRSGDHVLVKFYLVSAAHTWGWVRKEDVHPFGSLSADIEMLLQVRQSKKAYRINEVKNAYRHVCERIHIDPELALNQAFQTKKK